MRVWRDGSEWELVLVWQDGTRDVYEYMTKEDAERGGRNTKMAAGNQLEWYGVRRKG